MIAEKRLLLGLTAVLGTVGMLLPLGTAHAQLADHLLRHRAQTGGA